MAIHTYGPAAVDWEQRVDLPRLRVRSGWRGCARSWSARSWGRC